MPPLNYDVKPIQLYHPAGKKEIRLVYRVFSREQEGLSTRHQKSFSMTKYGEQIAWEKAREAYEFIEHTGKLPSDIELPSSALVVSQHSRRSRGLNGSSGSPRPKPMKMATSLKDSINKNARMQGVLPLYTDGQASLHPEMDSSSPHAVNYLKPENISGGPLLFPKEPVYGSDLENMLPTQFNLPSNSLANKPDDAINKVLRLLQQGMYTDTSEMVGQQVLSCFPLNGGSTISSPLDIDSESSLWAKMPPYSQSLLGSTMAADGSYVWAPVPIPQAHLLDDAQGSIRKNH